MKEIKFILLKLKKYYLFILLATLGSLIEGATYSGITFILKDVIDDVFIEKNLAKLKLLVIAILAIAIFRQVGILLKEASFPYASFKLLKELRQEAFVKILGSRPEFIYKRDLGDIISRVSNDIFTLKESLQKIGVDLLSQFFTVIFMIGVLIYIDWKLFIIILLLVPILFFSLSYFGKLREKYSKYQQESISNYTQFISQLIQGFELLKLFSTKILKIKFNKINNDIFNAQVKSILTDVFYLSSVEVVSYFTVALIISYGGYRIINGELTTGEFFAFLGALLILVNSAQVFQRGLLHIKIVQPIVRRIQDILNLPQEKDEGIEFKGLKKQIIYKNVNLEIDGNEILKDINLSIKSGQKLAIIGLTGSGKSTLVKLLPALVRGYRGEIFIDEHELKEYKPSSLRKHIGMISQEVFIFNDTLRNNLLIAKPDATDEQLLQALKKAKANFVENLENGLDTVLGEKGSRLSGGEKQRISIARIFLKNPEILIIDEGTSALDVETEEYIMDEIKNHFKNKTILMITHRLSIIDVADKIVVIENGKIIEEGSFSELIKKKGAFYRFYTLSQNG
ncbi:MAG TPA: ABC transporter ATP-binding protein [Hydrogenothermaceae bacterium]|nr:ABC transporter ATP-binding protein [Hydrogenothermaceae bacterium]